MAYETRIKVVSTLDGEFYYPQIRFSGVFRILGWWNLYPHKYTDKENNSEGLWLEFNYRKLEDAKRAIDKWLIEEERDKIEQQKKQNRKIVSKISIIKYP